MATGRWRRSIELTNGRQRLQRFCCRNERRCASWTTVPAFNRPPVSAATVPDHHVNAAPRGSTSTCALFHYRVEAPVGARHPMRNSTLSLRRECYAPIASVVARYVSAHCGKSHIHSVTTRCVSPMADTICGASSNAKIVLGPLELDMWPFDL